MKRGPHVEDRETLDLFTPDPVGAVEERERVLTSMEAGRRRAMIIELRNRAAAICRQTGEPVSTNDVRADLRAMGYEGDARILGAVFRGPSWKIVGETRNDMKHNHATPIRLFMLVEEP